MPLPRTSLQSFLSLAKTALDSAAQHSTPVSFVVGNESADLDSLCSAIVFAYLRTYTSLSTSEAIQIPLSNLPRADLSLRPELRPVLSRAQIQLIDFITISDLPQPTRLEPQKTRWILVDHNALQGELGSIYSSRVVGTIDHHDDENQIPEDCRKEPRIIRKSGSCTSLVIEHCREAWDTVTTQSRVQETASWDTELAHLALAPILIDTNNLKDMSRVTQADVRAVEYLESKITTPTVDYSRNSYFEQISSAKSDIGTLNSYDILRKDYKEWRELGSINLGISSVVKDVNFLLSKSGSLNKFLDAIRGFAADRKLSLYALMTISSINEKLNRELFVYALDEKGVAAARKFERDTAETLGLTKWGTGQLDSKDPHDCQHEWRSCWTQSRVENSRKQVGPLLRKAVNNA